MTKGRTRKAAKGKVSAKSPKAAHPTIEPCAPSEEAVEGARKGVAIHEPPSVQDTLETIDKLEAAKKISEGLRPEWIYIGCAMCGQGLAANLHSGASVEGGFQYELYKAGCPVCGFETVKSIHLPAAGV